VEILEELRALQRDLTDLGDAVAVALLERAETVQKLRSFREAFAQRRCVVPTDGFFEWTGPKEDRKPIWFHRSDGGLILFAGLYESWRPSPAEERTENFHDHHDMGRICCWSRFIAGAGDP